jgi:hypothetical protein
MRILKWPKHIQTKQIPANGKCYFCLKLRKKLKGRWNLWAGCICVWHIWHDFYLGLKWRSSCDVSIHKHSGTVTWRDTFETCRPKLHYGRQCTSVKHNMVEIMWQITKYYDIGYYPGTNIKQLGVYMRYNMKLHCTFALVSWQQFRCQDPGSSGSIVSDYGLDDRAIEVQSPAGVKDFSSSLCVQTGSGAHSASCTMGTGVHSLGVKRGRGVTLITHPHLVPRSWMSRSYTSFPPKRLHGV